MELADPQAGNATDLDNVAERAFFAAHQDHGAELHHVACLRISRLIGRQALGRRHIGFDRGPWREKTGNYELIDKYLGLGVLLERGNELCEELRRGFIVVVAATQDQRDKKKKRLAIRMNLSR